jgi:uncharacterized protein (TIGR02271 family)
MQSDRDIMRPGAGPQAIVPGTTVYDAAGDKLGSVHDYDPRGAYLVVQKGLFFPKDRYVPTDAIARATLDGVFLTLSKRDLDDERYGTVPVTRVRTAGTDSSALETDSETVTTRRTMATPTDVAVPPVPAEVLSPPKQPASDRFTDAAAHPQPPDDGDLTVPVREEELLVGTQRAEAGRVRVHKDVVEEQQALRVPVTHEEVQVERVPVDRDLPADQLGTDVWQEKDIDVPLMGEQVVAEKQAHVAEELHLHKEAVTEQQQVADTVRKERVEVSAEPADLVPDVVDGDLDKPPRGTRGTGRTSNQRRRPRR